MSSRSAGFAVRFRAALAGGSANVVAHVLALPGAALPVLTLPALLLPTMAHAQAAAAAAAAAPAGAAQAAPAADEAQPAPPPANASGGPVGNEIVVTATKRAQTLQSVPVAVTVTTAATIERAQIRDVADLSTVVPSLKVDQHESSGEVNFLIRGFGNGANNVGIEPSVGVFVDGVYRSRTTSEISDFDDVARIEVLRGPQSTLFGKNASAGVISITTNEPQFTLHANFEGSYENYNGVVFRGVVTGPVTKTLAVSLAAGIDHRDGYNYDAGTGQSTNNRNRWYVRGQALWEPSSQIKVRLIADYDKMDELCCGVVNLKASGATQIIQALGGQVNPASNPFGDVVYSNFDSTNRIKNYGFSGQLDYDLGPFKLTSITAWRKNDANTNEDADFSSADLLENFSQQLGISTFTQELRLTSNLPGPLNFLVGGYYFDEHINQANQLAWGSQARNYFNGLIEGDTAQLAQEGVLPAPLTLTQVEGALSQLTGTNLVGSFFGQGQGQYQNYTLGDQSASIFAQADYKVTPKLTLTGGVNYTHDSKHFTEVINSTDVFSNLNLPALVNGGIGAAAAQGYAAGGAAGAQAAGAAAAAQLVPLLALMPLQIMPTVLGIPNAVEPGRTSDGDVTWTARAAYDATSHVKLYLNFGTGFKASSINLSRDARPALADAGALQTAGLAGPPTVAITGTPYVITTSTYGSRAAGPEHSTLFEGGVKADWGVATLNLALFKEIIKGFQSELFTGTGFFLSNAGQESEWGIEAEGSVRPTRELTLSGAIDWYNPKYDSFNISSVGDLTGTKPAGIPPVTVNLAAEENHRLASGDHIILRGDWHYESRTQMVEGLPGEVARNPITQAVISDAPAVALAQQFTRQVSEFDASLTYAFHNGLDLMVWGRNLTNDRYLITVFDSPAQSGSISGYTNQPRTYGVSARIRW